MREFKKQCWFEVIILANRIHHMFGVKHKWIRDRMSQIATWASYNWIRI